MNTTDYTAAMDLNEIRGLFWAEVTKHGRAECWLQRFAPDKRGCQGRIQACHLIPKQEIKRAVHRKLTEDAPSARAYELRLAAIVYDARTAVPGCERDHHRLDTSRLLKIPRKYLPAVLEEFAKEHGLEAWLDREYGERLGI